MKGAKIRGSIKMAAEGALRVYQECEKIVEGKGKTSFLFFHIPTVLLLYVYLSDKLDYFSLLFQTRELYKGLR